MKAAVIVVRCRASCVRRLCLILLFLSSVLHVEVCRYLWLCLSRYLTVSIFPWLKLTWR